MRKGQGIAINTLISLAVGVMVLLAGVSVMGKVISRLDPMGKGLTGLICEMMGMCKESEAFVTTSGCGRFSVPEEPDVTFYSDSVLPDKTGLKFVLQDTKKAENVEIRVTVEKHNGWFGDTLKWVAADLRSGQYSFQHDNFMAESKRFNVRVSQADAQAEIIIEVVPDGKTPAGEIAKVTKKGC